MDLEVKWLLVSSEKRDFVKGRSRSICSGLKNVQEMSKKRQ